MSVAKVIEIMSNSNKSWDDAIKKGLERAAKTIRHIKSFHVVDMKGKVDEKGQIKEYKVRLKIAFEVE
ncbi:MAG: dodecin family protein [Candidatus Anstonellales archaeon]